MRNIYLERYAHPESLTSIPPHPGLGIIITIPAFNEPDVRSAVESILACQQPGAAVEILILINHPEDASARVKRVNELGHSSLLQLSNSNEKVKVLSFYKAINKKHAGVGLARKILMDEAVRRFEAIGNNNGIIIGFDADCTCSINYLTEIEKFFDKNPNASGCSIHFEHPINETTEQKAAYEYELHLRCYIDALRWSGIPHAFQTIGSSMAVNHKAYQRQGGMNKRKAGEDFYFLHRIIREGNFGDLATATVFPSARVSERVPFGTGKAVLKWLEKGEQTTYNIQSYILLKAFIIQVENLYDNKNKPVDELIVNLNLPEIVRSFLFEINFTEELERIFASSSSKSLFEKHFFQWFDGFKVMKYLHYLRDKNFPDVPVLEAAEKMRKLLSDDSLTEQDILSWYRSYDRNHPGYLKY